MEIVVKDGVRYLPHRYKDETELENLVRMHVNFIFGNNSLFLEKTKIKSKADIGSIPDGFVLLPSQERWCIVEVELSRHRPHEHIVSQLSKFYSAINSATIKKLINAFYEKINKNPDLLNYIDKITGGEKERYKLLTDIFDKDPEFVIIIDKETSKLEGARKSLRLKSTVIKFKTYLREDSNVPIHIFDVLEAEKSIAEKPVIPTKKIPSRGDKKWGKKINQILEVVELVWNQDERYTEAVKIVANNRGIQPATVRDHCTRRIGLNTDGFKELLKDKEELINHLIKKLPDKKQIIDKTLKG